MLAHFGRARDKLRWCSNPDGSDPDEPLLDLIRWLDQELRHRARP